MKNIKKCLTLFIVCLFIIGTTHAQWYCYDSYENKSSKGGADARNAIQTIMVKTVPDSSKAAKPTSAITKSLRKNLEAYKLKKDTALKKLQDDIAKVLAKQTFPPDSAIIRLSDTLNKKYLAIIADRTVEDEFKLQIAQFQYALTRVPWGKPFFPVRSAKAAISFFDNIDTVLTLSKEGVFLFEHAYLNYLSSSKKLAAYTEALTDYVGPVRVSLGLLGLLPASKDSAVSTKKSDSVFNKKTFQDRFKSGGGVAQINFAYPLLHIHDNKYIDFKMYASPRFCIDIPREDTSIQRIAHHTQLGIEAQLKLKTFNDQFNFLFCFRGMQAWGNTAFYDNMGFTGNGRKNFNFNTYTVGFIAKGTLAFYYTWYGGDSRVINQAGQANNKSLTANFQF